MLKQKCKELYPNKEIVLELRSFNKRAIKCYKKEGFKIMGVYTKKTPIGYDEFIKMIMKNNLNEKYELVTLKEDHIKELYSWNTSEKNFQYYTCRPLRTNSTFNEYKDKTLKELSCGNQKIYVLIEKEDNNIPIGKITLFDFNSRNHSAEFGYYMPEKNRGKGIGSIMLCKFIYVCFNDKQLNLNKIYATTSSSNHISIKLLEKFKFKLEGRLREHYWINDERYDQLVYSMLRNDHSD